MNGHDFSRSERLWRAKRNQFLINAAIWLACFLFLYGLGELVCKWSGL